MTHQNPNKRQRAAARRYAAEHQVSYQDALRRVRDHREDRTGPAWSLVPVEDLRGMVADHVARHGVVMDDFTPFELVEGDIEEAVLSSIRVNGPIELGAAEPLSEPDAAGYAIEVRVHGEGDVDWHVSAPTGADLAAFGSAVENAEHGGGFFPSYDSAVGVTLDLAATYDPQARAWRELTVRYAGMLASEAERRARRHADEEFRRLQAWGLEPSDEEIDAMEEDHGGAL